MTRPNLPTSLVGTQVGNVRLEARLGAGGMGEVYLGYDPRLDRRVAVKTIRADQRFDPGLKARFRREARILSKLEHPAICQVYDLVEGDEADFLIFEYVPGRSLRQVMSEGRLAERRALEIGERIAQALAAAHRERIVHRDLKPDNVMVLADGGVKILDFGISRMLAAGIEMGAGGQGQEAGETPAHPALADPAATTLIATGAAADGLGDGLTQHGFALGTVRYMSPEQARAEEVAEPSDLYSFGILLQEMLTGQAAYAGGLAPAEMVQRVAAARTLPLEGLDPELKTFVERLESPAPPERPTALEAAERLRALLERPARRRRRRLRLALAAGAFLFLAAVLAVVSVLALRANTEAARANREAARANSEAARAGVEAQNARQVVAFVVALFREAGPDESRGRPLTALEMVDRGAAQVGTRFVAQPLARARFQQAIGQLYWQLGNFPAAEEQLAAAIANFEQDPAGETLELATSRGALANVLADRGELEAAADLFARAAASGEKLAPDSPELAGLLGDYGALRWRQGELEAAAPLLERALAIDAKVFGPDAAELAERRNNLAIVAWQMGDLPRAQELFERALLAKERLEGPDHPDVVALLNNLGILLREQGEVGEAEALHRRALEIGGQVLGRRHPELASVWYSLGRALALEGRRPEAAEAFEQAIELHRAARGGAFFEIGRALVQIGELERQEGKLAAAAGSLARAGAILEAGVGADHPAREELRQALSRLAADRLADNGRRRSSRPGEQG
jgi:tetratricopeptide (TPR) repeat protein/predicted Ser/Thr protein kinase